MTSFQAPLMVGVDTGEPITSTKNPVENVLMVPVSSNTQGRNYARSFPAGHNEITRITTVLQTPPGAALTAGLNIRIGDTAGVTKFCTFSVSASGQYLGTLTSSVVSAGTDIIINTTAQQSASASQVSAFSGHVYIHYISYGEDS